MAQAKKVKPGQVWTAKVSGKETQVEILGQQGATAAGRAKFQYKNLETGRTVTGTAGKLHELVSDGNPGAPVSAPASSPSPPARRPAPRPPVPSARPAPSVRSAPPRRALPFGFAPAGPAPSAPVTRPNSRSAGSSLPSLRGGSSSSPVLTNPTEYPSPAAESAAQALSASSAQTPWDVLQVIQAWASQLGAVPPSMAMGWPAPRSAAGWPPGSGRY